MLWPLGWGAASIMTQGLLDFMSDQSFLASGVIGGSAGYTLQNLIGVAVLGGLADFQYDRRAGDLAKGDCDRAHRLEHRSQQEPPPLEWRLQRLEQVPLQALVQVGGLGATAGGLARRRGRSGNCISRVIDQR